MEKLLVVVVINVQGESETRYSLGDEVNFKGTSENFYILSDNGITVTMLAKYRLNTKEATYIQEEYTYNVNFGSKNNYLNSKIKTKVEKYATDLGLDASACRLMTRDEVVRICQEINSSYNGNYEETFPLETPAWLYSTDYWLGTSSGMYEVWYVRRERYLDDLDSSQSSLGLRPVLEVSKSLIQSAT